MRTDSSSPNPQNKRDASLTLCCLLRRHDGAPGPPLRDRRCGEPDRLGAERPRPRRRQPAKREAAPLRGEDLRRSRNPSAEASERSEPLETKGGAGALTRQHEAASILRPPAGHQRQERVEEAEEEGRRVPPRRRRRGFIGRGGWPSAGQQRIRDCPLLREKRRWPENGGEGKRLQGRAQWSSRSWLGCEHLANRYTQRCDIVRARHGWVLLTD
jgi:hypothetical protein